MALNHTYIKEIEHGIRVFAIDRPRLKLPRSRELSGYDERQSKERRGGGAQRKMHWL